MTFREKWLQDHPGHAFDPVCRCPSMFGYEPEGVNCANPKKISDMARVCGECWNREMPENTNVTLLPYKPGDVAYGTIKDSGERRQFETGAVRDIQEGKGRCDLMPLEVVGSVINGVEGAVIGHIAMFKETNATAELYLALAKFAERAYSRSRPAMLLEVAKHFEEGAKKYGENNWQKGLPVHCYIDSAVRHYLKWLRGDKDEPHDRAFVWNLMCCIWEVDYSPRAKGENVSVAEEAPAPEVNSGRLYICNREPCEKCHSDCHCTMDIRNAAVLKLGDRGFRYEDCPIGLFLTNDGVFLKTKLIDVETGLNTAVHIGLGLSRKFEADTMVTPIKYPFKERERV